MHHQKVNVDFLKISICGEAYSETNAKVSIFVGPSVSSG